MLCHECGRVGRQRPAVAQCRFCLVGLCKPHLVAAREEAPVPQYACRHHPERPFNQQDAAALVAATR